MSVQLQEILDDVESLISLPAAYIRLNELVEDPSSSIDAIAQVIAQDPGLAARVLRVANSPLYGFTSKIDTIARATTVLGTRPIRDLALATVAMNTFEGIPNDLVNMDNFWKHSIYCALCARTLAMECLKSQREAVFVTGLLHDIGQLILYNRLPELSRKVLEVYVDGPNSLETQEVEREIIGFDHAEVGGQLAQRWSLPANIREGIAYHHQPGEAKEARVETAIIHIANSLATLAELDETDLSHAPVIQPIAWELTGLEEDIIEPVIGSAQAQFSSARASLMGGE